MLRAAPPPRCRYDLVMCSYVLTEVPSAEERQRIVRNLWGEGGGGGVLHLWGEGVRGGYCTCGVRGCVGGVLHLWGEGGGGGCTIGVRRLGGEVEGGVEPVWGGGVRGGCCKHLTLFQTALCGPPLPFQTARQTSWCCWSLVPPSASPTSGMRAASFSA